VRSCIRSWFAVLSRRLVDEDKRKSRAMPVEYGNPLYLLANLTSA